MSQKEIDIKNKIIIITGANAGLGYEITLELAKRGATIIMACRDTNKAKLAVDNVKSEVSNASIDILKLDLADTQSIREFAKNFKAKYNRLDVLINNAGIFVNYPAKTKDGFGLEIGVNHLGHFLLTSLLLDVLKKSAPSRIIVVSSALYDKGKINWDDINLEKHSSGFTGLHQSKLANILFTMELAERLKGTGVTVVSCCPGWIKTDGANNFNGVFGCFIKTAMKAFADSPKKGVQMPVHCTIGNDVESHAGEFYSEKKWNLPNPKVTNKEDAKRLWNLSLQMLKMDSF